MAIDPRLLEAAADWHVRLAGDDPDFDGFTVWLEASADHGLAYDRVMELDDAIDLHRDQLAAALPANDVDEVPVAPHLNSGRRRFLAAALLVAMALPAGLWLTTLRQVSEVSSSGERREFALDDRTRIVLDANSEVRHRQGRTDAVALERGAALFAVRHDPARRFAVTAGDVEIVDLGTRFEVTYAGGHVSVAVAEGSVALHSPKAPEVTLTAGQRADIAAGTVTISASDPAMIATWRSGQLVYRNASLQQVAREVSRYTPQPLVLDPAIAGRRFSGVLTIGDGTTLDRNLADFMGLALRRDGSASHLGARPQ
jgi:transmembrane sensor